MYSLLLLFIIKKKNTPKSSTDGAFCAQRHLVFLQRAIRGAHVSRDGLFLISKARVPHGAHPTALWVFLSSPAGKAAEPRQKACFHLSNLKAGNWLQLFLLVFSTFAKKKKNSDESRSGPGENGVTHTHMYMRLFDRNARRREGVGWGWVSCLHLFNCREISPGGKAFREAADTNQGCRTVRGQRSKRRKQKELM